MSNSTPQFVEVRKAPDGRFVFTQDLNAVIDRIVAIITGRFPASHEGEPHKFGSTVFLLHIYDEWPGAAKYKCTAYAPFGKDNFSDPDTDLDSDALTTEEIETEAMFVNLFENGGTGHALLDPEVANSAPLWAIGLLVDEMEDGGSVFVGTILPVSQCTDSSTARPGTIEGKRVSDEDTAFDPANDQLIILTTAATTATAPAASTSTDLLLTVKNASPGTVYFAPDGSDTVEGAGPFAIAAGESWDFSTSTSTNWVTV